MIKEFILYLCATNGRRKTAKDILIVTIAPWALFAVALVLNMVGKLSKSIGFSGIQHIALPVVFVACALLSIACVIGYLYSWWNIYRKTRRRVG